MQAALPPRGPIDRSGAVRRVQGIYQRIDWTGDVAMYDFPVKQRFPCFRENGINSVLHVRAAVTVMIRTPPAAG